MLKRSTATVCYEFSCSPTVGSDSLQPKVYFIFSDANLKFIPLYYYSNRGKFSNS